MLLRVMILKKNIVGLQPTVIASRAPHLLLEQSVMIRRIVDVHRPSKKNNIVQISGLIPESEPDTILHYFIPKISRRSSDTVHTAQFVIKGDITVLQGFIIELIFNCTVYIKS